MKLTSSLVSLVAGLFFASGALAQEALKIGMITTLSGPAGYLGQDVRDGFQLAIDMEGGKLGGVPVKVLVEDDGLKPGNGRQIAEKFLNDEGVKLFTGIVFSNVAGATVPEIVDADAIFVSPNAGPSEFAGKGCHPNYFVMSWLTDTMQGSAGQNATDLGYKKAFVLAPNYQAGKDAIAGFKRYFKGEVAGEIYTRLDQTDFAAEMAQIKAANPDVVFQFQPGGLGIAFLRQYQQSGLLGTVPMVIAEPSMDHAILKAVGEAAAGLNVSGSWNTDLDNETNREFVAKFADTYKRTPTMYAAQGYDTALAIASALKQTEGDVEDIEAFRAALLKTEFKTTRGSFSFGKNQHPVQDWYAMQVVKDAAGEMTLKTRKKLLSAHGDPFAGECDL
ncbi:branched-chain amino acid transport system substrate-binding protein [Aminobacter lissarensis]|uniref:Branched-chain amino acid transport system substrate-binding protein n=1 Tax=Aminobacter carboxidus TaxID=376165 RepID=A0A8E2BD70_9HYPH|nr:ABC transporter substrate-binding protein [Aminobacter lissarensis]MBB6466477.1 branched-chain amino acid transport system substrate-binding protein [Aminobacter lissarensis]